MKKTEEIWISSLEAIDLWGIKKQTFYYYRDNDKLICRPAKCDDGSKTEVQLCSLPEEIQQKYFEANKPSEELAETDSAAAAVDNYELDAEQNEIALAKADFLRLYLEEADKATRGTVRGVKKDFIKMFNTGIPFPNIYKKIGEVNFKSVERWKTEWIKSGKDYRVLGRRPSKKGSTVTKDEAEILIKYLLTPNNSPVKECVDMAIKQMIRQRVDNIKHYKTYVRWAAEFKSKNFDVWVLIREGEKALKDKALKSIFRDYDKISVGDIIVADGHTLNFEIINPYTGKYKRMTMILFYDMKSSMPLGWEISITENTQSIAVAFYRSVLRLQKFPKVVYLDNGRAFRSKYFNGADLEEAGIVGLFEKCKVRVMFARPYNAKAKTVERFFKTFAQLERSLPTYCGTSIGTQPPRMKRNEKMHRAVYEEMLKRTKMTIYDAHQLIAEWFDEYANTPQQSGHLKGQTPFEVFAPGVGDGVDATQLIYLMLEERNVPVKRHGIKLFGKYYWNRELHGLAGSRVDIRIDFTERNMIYYKDPETDTYKVASLEAGAHPAAGPLGDEYEEIHLREMLKEQAELEKETKLKAKALLTNHMVGEVPHSIDKKVDELVKLGEKKKETKQLSQKIEKSNVFNSLLDDTEIEEDTKHDNLFNKLAAEG